MTIAEANEPLSNGLKIIIAQKGLKNLYVAESAGYTPQEFRGISHFRSVMTESILRYSHTGEHCQKNRLDG